VSWQPNLRNNRPAYGLASSLNANSRPKPEAPPVEAIPAKSRGLCDLTGALAAAIVGAVAGLPAASADELVLLDGRRLEGRIASWSDRALAWQAETATEVPFDQLLSLAVAVPTASHGESGVRLELADGSSLAVQTASLKERRVQLAGGDLTESQSLDGSQVRTIRFPTDPSLDAAVAQALADDEAAGDVLVLVKQDAVDSLVGKLASVADDRVSFEWEGETIEIARSKIAAISLYSRKQAEVSPPLAVVSTIDGSKFALKSVELTDGELSAVIASGLRLSLPWSRVSSVDFSRGKLVYLSDLEPVLVRWIPYIELPPGANSIASFGNPRRDRSFSGSPLQLFWSRKRGDAAGGDQRSGLLSYAKGLALRSRTELEYRVPRGMTRMTTVAGIDPAALAEGAVFLEIRGDGQILWQGEIAGKAPPTEIAVELKECRRLQLLVDYGSNLDLGDRLHLVEARFSK
jgi:hypothetical protein